MKPLSQTMLSILVVSLCIKILLLTIIINEYNPPVSVSSCWYNTTLIGMRNNTLVNDTKIPCHDAKSCTSNICKMRSEYTLDSILIIEGKSDEENTDVKSNESLLDSLGNQIRSEPFYGLLYLTCTFIIWYTIHMLYASYQYNDLTSFTNTKIAQHLKGINDTSMKLEMIIFTFIVLMELLYMNDPYEQSKASVVTMCLMINSISVAHSSYMLRKMNELLK